MNDEDRATIQELKADVRLIIDRLLEEYPKFLMQHHGDDDAAFLHLIKFIEVGRETGYIPSERVLTALLAFSARRLAYHRPRLITTLN